MKDKWRELPAGPDIPNVVNVVVEIPKGSRNKYEFDKDLGMMLDRVLYSPLHYPGDYGFIPQTLYDDGDPMDVLVLMDQPTFPGCIIEARPVALMRMVDGGEKDDKILAVPVEDPRYEYIQDKDDVPQHVLKEIAHFFEAYKHLEDKTVNVNGWDNRDAAVKAVKHSLNLYKRKTGQTS